MSEYIYPIPLEELVRRVEQNQYVCPFCKAHGPCIETESQSREWWQAPASAVRDDGVRPGKTTCKHCECRWEWCDYGFGGRWTFSGFSKNPILAVYLMASSGTA